MLAEGFYWLLNMSIAGGAVGLLLLALRKIKRIPRSFLYGLWIAPMIRLSLPFGLSGQYSIMTLISKFAAKTVPVFYTDDSGLLFSCTNYIQSAEGYFPLVYKTDRLETVFQVLSYAWVTVAAAALLTAGILYYFTKKEVRNARHLRGNVYISHRITAPALYGVFCPKIILPASLEKKDRKYVIMHERAHAKRGDNFWRAAGIFLCCVHWFNPVCWLCLKYFFEDMELSCDCRVLKGLDREDTKAYALSVLSAAAGRSPFPSAFGGAGIKIRIENILSYKRLTLAASLVSGLLTATVILWLVTNALPSP